MLALVLMSACAALAQGDAASKFHPEKLREIDDAISLAIADGRTPGAVLWIEHRGAAYRRAYGNRALEPKPEPMTEDTIFDAASLTKVVATTTAVMQLAAAQKLELDGKVSAYVPEFRGAGKEAITVRQLLTHTSGLRAGLPGFGGANVFMQAWAEPLPDVPGAGFRYSDINYILLGELVARVSGKSLESYCAEHIFQPLGMAETAYRPAERLLPRVAPTTRTTPRGTVHDPTARRMGGVAGHAGLFTTVTDLARFARMLLARGTLEGAQILAPESVRAMTSVQTPETVAARRGFGWDIDSPYAGPRGAWFPIGSYGHTGWTGTSLWIDPFSETFVILLTNRNHPSESGNVIALRRQIGTLAAEAIRGFNFAYVPGALPPKGGNTASVVLKREPPTKPDAPVLTGIDLLAREKFARLRGLRVGLITNHTGIDRDRRATIDLLAKADGVKLVALFSPEHGIRGQLDEKVGDSRDEKTGLPIHSLYGERRTPTPELLAELDALVFDIADIGTRFYTYISTLGECMVAAAGAGKTFIVLDRPNPVTGARVEGPMLAAARSFTAWHELPVRHGMTVGELAKMFAAERAPKLDLTVVPCENWSRGMWFDETGLPWLNPSPNMRSLAAAVLYPGVGLLEFCNLSVGRGTDRPFEMLGAPYIDERALAAAINEAELAGIRAMPVRFTPVASVFKGQECRGVQLLLTDRDAALPLDLGIVLATTLQRLYPQDAKINKMERLLAHPPTLTGILEGKSAHEVKQTWTAARTEFSSRREKYLIYR